MVQAGVAGGADSIIIKQARRHTLVTWPACAALSIAELSDALANPKAKPQGPLGHLVVGLRAAGMGQGRSFVVSGPDGRLAWEARTSEMVADFQSRPTNDQRIKVDFPAGEVGRYLGPFFRTLGRATDEYLDVVFNADACPVPLTFDGRRLDGFDCPVDGKRYLVEQLAKGWIKKPHDGLPALTIPARALKQAGGEPSGTASLMYKLHFHARSDQPRAQAPCSRLSWLIDGVIGHYEETRLSGQVTCELYISADGLRTDLSGMALLNSEAKKQRMRAAFQLFLPTLRQIQQDWTRGLESLESSWNKHLDREGHERKLREMRERCHGLGYLARQLEGAAEH